MLKAGTAVVAPPGAGKTSFILSRAEKDLQQIKPWEKVLFLTFTKKAALELRKRTPREKKEQMLSFTFHGFSLWLLRNYFSFFSKVIPPHKKREIIKEIQKEMNGVIKTIETETLEDYISFVKNTTNSPGIPARQSPYARVFYEYQERLKRLDAVDFDDLIILAAENLSRRKDIRDSLQERFKSIYIDEAQDMNLFQFELTKKLGQREITIVGDPNQSIYGWRGASPQFFEKIKGELSNNMLLRKNFRNPPSVFTMAEKVIPPRDRIGKIEFAKKDRPLSVIFIPAHGHDEIKALQKIAEKLGKIWVLVRRRKTREELQSIMGADSLLGRVNIYTAHSAKGLEFPTVVIFSLKRGEYPPRGMVPSAEERRLLYVAITRAQERLIIFYDPASPSPLVEMLGISG